MTTNEASIIIGNMPVYGDECYTIAEYQEAKGMAIEALVEALKNQWIPCCERLPEEVGTYMTTVDYENHGIAVGQRYYHGKSLGWEDDCVIAWMPLPKPYEGRTE